MLQRQSQTASFWRDQFELSPSDLDFIYNLLLDAQAAKPLSVLSIAVIEEYLRRENAKIESELSKGDVYMPQGQYAIGQTLVFPALDFVVGEVLEKRAGENPEHGEFEVIRVRLDDTEREFAVNLHTPHRLNQSNGGHLVDDNALLSPAEIYSLYAGEIDDAMLYALQDGERASEFVEVDGEWLLMDMLTEVHIGHLNIAEALIEVEGKPLSPDRLLIELDLDENNNALMQLISLNHALGSDQRFEAINFDDTPLWYLTRLEPAEVVTVPALLRCTSFEYNRALLSVELLQVEWELDDEWGESSLSNDAPSLVPNTSFTLTYPHRLLGTLPISGRTRSFFPNRSDGLSMVTLIDGRWGTQFSGWVAHSGRYVAGLGKWMEDHGLPVGAQITLERSKSSSEVVVDYRTRRAKREWARMAAADMESKRLRFEMNKIQVACEYDEYMIFADSNPQTLEELRMWIAENNIPLTDIVEQVVPELTKLNPQGTVHAKSVYSAVNMLRRCAPGPIFYALIGNRKFQDVGGGFFALG